MTQYILRKDYEISSSEVDLNSQLKISALVNIFIHAATQNVYTRCWGVDDLAEHNLVWVISSLRIKVLKYPSWQDKVTCETWVKGLERLFYQRDFRLLDTDGNILAEATSRWLMIDQTSRRPKLIPFDDAHILLANKDTHGINEGITAPLYDAETEISLEHTVRYSDVDMNRHMTTTRYLELMLDTYPLADIAHCQPREFTVTFMKEALFGDQLEMQRCTNSKGNHSFRLMSKDQKRPSFLGEFVF